jgi:hypothetical protein
MIQTDSALADSEIESGSQIPNWESTMMTSDFIWPPGARSALESEDNQKEVSMQYILI